MTFKEELMEILKGELDLVDALKELTYKKTDIIIGNELEQLEGITKEELELVNRMAIAEENRLKLMDSWGVNMNTSLSEIIEEIPEEKEDILRAGEDLSNSLQDIKETNQINNELISDNLQWLDFNMNLISNIQTPSTYGKKQKSTRANNSLFDRKV